MAGRACPEEAIALPDQEDKPILDFGCCLFCGQCLKVCPTGTLKEGTTGFRVQVGGKLGRHPQLARDLGKIFSQEELLKKLNEYLDLYQTQNQKGERLGEILNRLDRSSVIQKQEHQAAS